METSETATVGSSKFKARMSRGDRPWCVGSARYYLLSRVIDRVFDLVDRSTAVRLHGKAITMSSGDVESVVLAACSFSRI
jgi:hypothetical protein